jgi:uncharacterized protein YdaL
MRKRALVIAVLLGSTVLAPAGAAEARPLPAPANFAVPLAGEKSPAMASLVETFKTKERLRRLKPRETVEALSATVQRQIKATLGLGSVVKPILAGLTGTGGTTTGTSALVLYDTAGPYGFLGELYAMATANLAGRFGTVTTKPVQEYTAGETETHTATIYLGSTYYGGDIPDAVPDAFYTDVATTGRPVVWVGMNIWNLANKIGVSTFTTKYGWDATNSFFAGVGTSTVEYKGHPLTRTIPAGGDGGIVKPYVTDPARITSLATAQDPAGAFPWAVRSANLTYLGEIPYAYVNETDRVIAWHDLLFDALAPATPERHRAILRLEDISPNSDPAELQAIAGYLKQEGIPYGFQVIGEYRDPNGAYNNGVPEVVRWQDRPQTLNVLKFMLANGGRIISHGHTHQFGDLNNPYNGVTGDDFEFYQAHVDASDNVILDGPVPGDSASWAQSRVTAAKNTFPPLGLPVPQIWTTPHYAASAVDYGVIKNNFAARLERSLFFKGQLSGGPVDHSRLIGQFFPYPVTDVYGGKVLPENLGNYEPEAYNNHPPRFPADIIRAARYNLAVRDGFASFFYHPYFPVAPLQETVQGIKALGYTFVDPASVIP